MPKRNLDELLKRVQERAEHLIKTDDSTNGAQLAHELRQSGIDAEKLRREMFDAAKRLADRERAAGRPAPLALKQALEQLAPADVMPSSETAAKSKMARWFDQFSSSFGIPEQLEAARAYRKSGDISPEENADLDKLEQELKEKLNKERDGKG
jgi:paraquat-inducible protein B